MADKKYGKRPAKTHPNTGVRDVAPTHGKVAVFSASSKSGSDLPFLVDGQTEDLLSKILKLDPTVLSAQSQSLAVDLVERRLLFTKAERDEALKNYRGRHGPSLYTPDFGVEGPPPGKHAVEVKLEGFTGDDEYLAMLTEATSVLATFGYGFSRVVITRDQTKAPWTSVPYLYQASLRDDLRPNDEMVTRINDLALKGATTGSDFIAGLGIAPGMLLPLVAFGALSVDPLAGPICGASQMSSAHGDLSHLELLHRLRA